MPHPLHLRGKGYPTEVQAEQIIRKHGAFAGEHTMIVACQDGIFYPCIIYTERHPSINLPAAIGKGFHIIN